MILPRGKRVFHRSSGLNMAVHIEFIHKSFSRSIFLSPPSENELLSLCFPAFQACYFPFCSLFCSTRNIHCWPTQCILNLSDVLCHFSFFSATLCWSTYASQGSWFTKKNQTALKKKNGWEEICFSSHIALIWAQWYQKPLDDLVLADVASRKVVQDYLVRYLGEKIPGAAACGGHSFCYNPEKRSCR